MAMFLDVAHKLDLLAPNPDSNILGNFSLPVKKILVNQVVTHLLENKNGVTLLTSAAHVRWAMETVGQGFTLPIEDEDIITKVITLYRHWLLDPTKRPQPIQNDPQFFIQRILEHYSMLFQPRSHSPAVAEKHAALCSRVLDIYANIGMQTGDFLTKETWEIFLKLLISISDSILLNEPPAGLEALQKRLPGQMMKVLFEQFLFSGLQDPMMWNALLSRVRGWTRHMALMMTWKVTCFALTKRTLALIYGSGEGSESIIIKIDDSIHTINASREFTLYSWHRMFQILGNPNETIKDPAIFLAFVNGVEMLVNQYLKIGMSTKSKLKRNKAPDGNTILHVFGKWLFEAILIEGRDNFDEGKALALKTLCNIFTSKSKTSFLPTYTARFCMCIQSALMKEGRLLLAAILHGSSLIPLGIRGSRSLVPSFVYAINRILTKRVQNFDHIYQTDNVRTSCLKILSQIICLPNHFQHGEFKLRLMDKNSGGFDVSTYFELKPHICMTLIDSLTNETYPKNIETLLYLTYTWIVEDIPYNSSDHLKQALTLIIRKVTSHVAWPTEVTMVALDIMSAMSRLWSRFNIGEEQANFVVVNLCKYVSSQSVPSSRFPGKDAKEIEALVAKSFQCISDWILVSQWLFNYRETRADLLAAIVIGMTGKKQGQQPEVVEAPKKEVTSSTKKSKKESKHVEKQTKTVEKEIPPSEKIRNAAINTLLTTINFVGNFPTASGASSVSTLVIEEDILSDIASLQKISIEEAHQYMRFFITDDKVIIGALDRPASEEDGGPTTTIVVRDRTGKYAWDAHLSYVPHSDSGDNVRLDHMREEVSFVPFDARVDEMKADDITDITQYLEGQGPTKWTKLVNAQVEHESAYLAERDYSLNHEIAAIIPEPASSYEGNCKLQQSRMLLSHLGYLSLENRGRLFPIALSKEFFSQLKALDQVPERECIKVGVVYVRQGQTDVTEFLGNEGGTADYQEFLSSVGWGINVATHNGFVAGLDRKLSTGNVAPYWSNYSMEMIFLATTLMPNNDNSADHAIKRQQISNVYVCVIWAEPGKSYNPQLLWKIAAKCAVQIVITPQESGLYLVNIHTFRPEKMGMGPLFDGIILSKADLGTLVRETCINCHRHEKLFNEGDLNQFQMRQACIEDIFTRHKMDTTLEEFYGSLFTALPKSQIICTKPTKSHTSIVRRQSRAASRTPASAKKVVAPDEPPTPKKERSAGSNFPSTPAPQPPSSTASSPSLTSSNGGGDGAFGRVAPRSRPEKSGGLRMGSRGSAVNLTRGDDDDPPTPPERKEKKKKDKKSKRT